VRKAPDRVLQVLLPGFTAAANVVAPLTSVIVSWLGPPSEPRRLLKSVIDFGETLVREVMTPRPDIVAIKADATLGELRKLVQEQEYSRLPVFTENIDNIAGFIVVKDLFQLPEQPASDRRVRDFMRAAAFVPETNRVTDVLREFQQKRLQAAIVVDEYGGTAGLVTVEDVVEELVGEIRDEYDVEAEAIVREPDGGWVFSAKVAISDMTERLGVAIEGDGFETVGGFVLSRVGRVPVVGERFATDGLDIEVLEAERRRIHRVRVRVLPPPPEAEE
jgi:CBS domain containing-hemolysin-like protein